MINLSWYRKTVDSIDNLPEASGLYIISVLLRSGSYGAIYVGQATNIKKRILQHFSDSENNSELKQYLKNDYIFKVSYARLEARFLDEVEKFLIRYYDPFLNDKDGNGEKETECDLPNVIRFNR